MTEVSPLAPELLVHPMALRKTQNDVYVHPCKGMNPRQSWILDSTLWIPDSRYWISDSLSLDSAPVIPVIP